MTSIQTNRIDIANRKLKVESVFEDSGDLSKEIIVLSRENEFIPVANEDRQKRALGVNLHELSFTTTDGQSFDIAKHTDGMTGILGEFLPEYVELTSKDNTGLSYRAGGAQIADIVLRVGSSEVLPGLSIGSPISEIRGTIRPDRKE